MALVDDVARAIRNKDIESLTRLVFGASPPEIARHFRTENELWDFKRTCPKPGKSNASAWAELAKDVLAFHNNRGGIIIFGIRDEDFSFSGVPYVVDSKLFNDQVRRFVGDKIWVDYIRVHIESDQRHVALAVIPPRGPALQLFCSDAPGRGDTRPFRKNESAIRDGDSTRVLRGRDLVVAQQESPLIPAGSPFAVDQEFFRILTPEYDHFVHRGVLCEAVLSALKDPRTSVASLLGIGGLGKTALATWSALQAFKSQWFPLIVSTTAKDRQLSTTGIQPVDTHLTSFDALLDSIVEVVGFPDLKQLSTSEKVVQVRELLTNSNALLYVDNLETVDDGRVIEFLNDLPLGCRAIVTSRRSVVRVAARPIEVTPLNDAEAQDFVESLRQSPGAGYLEDLSSAELARLNKACDGIPLAIKWLCHKSTSSAELLRSADALASAGHSGEELLEFTFRRVFESMSQTERSILNVLAIFQTPLPSEAIAIGSGHERTEVADSLSDLVDDTIVRRLFDQHLNDYTYGVMPSTQRFIANDRGDSRKRMHAAIRRRLSDYFEARDVADEETRLVVRDIRQGKRDPESALVDLALGAKGRGQIGEAESLFEQALQRNPRSWRAAREYAEFCRHQLDDKTKALHLYEQAAANAPSRGYERALIYREWGILTRESGLPRAVDLAVKRFEEALKEVPNDPVCRHTAAVAYSRMGKWERVKELLKPLLVNPSPRTEELTLPLLLKAYEKLGLIVEAAQIRRRIEEMEQDH